MLKIPVSMVSCLLIATSIAHAQSCSIQDKILLAKQGYTKTEIEAQCTQTKERSSQIPSQGRQSRNRLLDELVKNISEESDSFDSNGKGRTTCTVQSSVSNGQFFLRQKQVRLYENSTQGSTTSNEFSSDDIDWKRVEFSKHSDMNTHSVYLPCKTSAGDCIKFTWNGTQGKQSSSGVCIPGDKVSTIRKTIDAISRDFK